MYCDGRLGLDIYPFKNVLLSEVPLYFLFSQSRDDCTKICMLRKSLSFFYFVTPSPCTPCFVSLLCIAENRSNEFCALFFLLFYYDLSSGRIKGRNVSKKRVCIEKEWQFNRVHIQGRNSLNRSVIESIKNTMRKYLSTEKIDSSRIDCVYFIKR